MTAEKIIHHYNRLNGNSISLVKLKEFRTMVQKYTDSNGHGTYMSDISGILSRVNKAIKKLIAENADGVERIELVPIDTKRTDGKILRVASGYNHEGPVPSGAESNVREIKISSIHTDTKRFQNRTDAFSEASANNVALHFDPNKFDPIVVWKDPANGKTYVLSGHSRYEGMKRRKSETIPVRFFEGTEQEAIKFARVEANRSANAENLIEDLAAYKLMRDGKEGVKPATKTELQRIFKGKSGKLEAYSHLNTGGLFVQALSQSNTSNYPYLERNAQWVGIIRNQYPVISNIGEDNIFHFFYSDKSGRNIKLSKDDFFALVKKKVNQLRKDESVLFPECSSDGCKQTVDREADPQKGEAFKRLREINEALENIREKLTSKDSTKRVATDEERKYLRATAEKLEEEKARINRDLDVIDKSQASLFGIDLGKIAKEEPLRTRQLRAMFARLANGGENLPKEKKIKGKTEPVKTAKQLKRETFVPKARGKKEIKKDYNDYRNDLNKETARRAFYWTSFNPERRGESFRDEYAATLTDFQEQIRPIAEKYGKLEEFESDFERYRKKMKELATAYLHSHSNVASAMITGPAKFPTERNRKKSDWADNKMRDYLTYDKRIREILKYKYLPDELKPVKTGQGNALDILKNRLAMREKNHEKMLAANKIIRGKYSDAEKVEKLVGIGFTESQAQKLLLPDWAGRKGFATFNLTNNNAEIKRLKLRIAEVEKLNAKREEGNKELTIGAAKVIENYEENRLQLIFDGKPDEKVRTLLKRSGFKWSPKNGAWQRQLTNNARWVLKRITPELTSLAGPQYDAFDIQPKKKHKGPLNPLQMAQLQDAIKAGRTPKVNLKAKMNAKQKPAPLFDEPVKDPAQASLFGAKKKRKSKSTLSGLAGADQLTSIQFYEHDLGPFKKEFHRLNSDSNVMIWGQPGHGKTVKLLQLAQHFASKGQNVLYVSNEEFGKSTLAEKIREFKIGHPNLSFAGELTEDHLDHFNVIFFDSVNSMGLTSADVKRLDRKYPNKLFFLIVQTTKEGDFRGGKDWEHIVDIAGEVRNRKLILRKNRLDKNYKAKADKLMIDELVEEQKQKQQIKKLVKEQTEPAEPVSM